MSIAQAFLLLLVGGALTIGGCSRRAELRDLQDVYGPAHVTFEQRELSIDLNADARRERVILLANRRRGLRLPQSALELSATVTVDGFAVFDGRHSNVPVFYHYADYDGLALRLDSVDGQQLLVSDGGRDQVQSVWGWWVHREAWPPDGWESRYREYNEQSQQWGDWKPRPKVLVLIGK